MAHYRLYLDESETRNASGSSFFVVGGVILNASSEVAVAQELNALKLSLWAGDQQATTQILHEKENGNCSFTCTRMLYEHDSICSSQPVSEYR